MEIRPSCFAYNSFAISAGPTSNAEYVSIKFDASASDSSWTNSQNRVMLYESLNEILLECSKEGWDGYNALPIEHSVALQVKQIINLIPYNLQLPELTPQADGEISFAWYRSRYHQFIFTIGKSWKIHYAGLLGNRRISGVKQFPEVKDLLFEARKDYQLSVAK